MKANQTTLLEASKELIRVIDALREVNVLGEWPVVREALQPLRAAVRAEIIREYGE